MFSTFWLWIKKYIFFGWVKALRSKRQQAAALAGTLAVCRGFIEDGKKVNAIKHYRRSVGVGLKEAKAEIDKLCDEIKAERDAEQEEYDEIEAICEEDLLPGESALDINPMDVEASLTMERTPPPFMEVDESDLISSGPNTIGDPIKSQVEEAKTCRQEDRETGIA